MLHNAETVVVEGKSHRMGAMAKTLLRHAKGIRAYYKTSLTSGKMEVINRKIRGLLWSAFGFRDHDLFKLSGRGQELASWPTFA